jgi:O-antigen ligase
MMEMSLGLVFGLIAKCGAHRKHLGPYIVAASIISLAIVLTTSRGGITSMLCMFLMAVASLVMGRRAKVPQDEDQKERSARGWGIALIARVVLGGAAFITFFIAVVWIGGDPLASRFERTNSDMVVQAGAVNPKEGRIRIWHGTLELIKAHPIMGVGFGGYATAIPRYHEDTGEFIPYEAHNDFLELQASGGVVGTILFVWFIVELFKRSSISLRSKQSFRKAVALGSLVGLCGVALHSLVDFGLHTPLNFIVCTILVVLITVRNPSSQEVPG